jgi:hypothetical protein
MIWLLVINIYAAPSDSVNWNGPWNLGTSRLMERSFQSEPECRNTAIQLIGGNTSGHACTNTLQVYQC